MASVRLQPPTAISPVKFVRRLPCERRKSSSSRVWLASRPSCQFGDGVQSTPALSAPVSPSKGASLVPLRRVSRPVSALANTDQPAPSSVRSASSSGAPSRVAARPWPGISPRKLPPAARSRLSGPPAKISAQRVASAEPGVAPAHSVFQPSASAVSGRLRIRRARPRRQQQHIPNAAHAYPTPRCPLPKAYTAITVPANAGAGTLGNPDRPRCRNAYRCPGCRSFAFLRRAGQGRHVGSAAASRNRRSAQAGGPGARPHPAGQPDRRPDGRRGGAGRLHRLAGVARWPGGHQPPLRLRCDPAQLHRRHAT